MRRRAIKAILFKSEKLYLTGSMTLSEFERVKKVTYSVAKRLGMRSPGEL